MYYRYWLHRAHHGVPAHFGVRTTGHKLIFFYGLPMGLSKEARTTPTWEFYDLKKDPEELVNLAVNPDHRPKLTELRTATIEVLREKGAGFTEVMPPVRESR